MRILLLSPYDARSHRYWREGIVSAMPEWNVTTLALPPRHFAWRFRGNSLALSRRDELAGDYDAVLATSMTDLASLRGLVPRLTRCPNVVYFHENQFDYPDDASDAHRIERQITSLYTALAGDVVIFNSEYNRQTFLTGASALLRKMPDEVPAGIVEHVEQGSRVLPVPLMEECYREPHRGDVFSVVWNHRWEHDKGPESLLEIVSALIESNIDFTFHLIGQPFRQVPEAIETCRRRLEAAGRLGRSGFLERTEYLELLASSTVVLSTALHEFQGLAVLEAMAAGCVPVVPDRLAYREYVPAGYRFDATASAAARIIDLSQRFYRGDEMPACDVTSLSWPAQLDAWTRVLE